MVDERTDHLLLFVDEKQPATAARHRKARSISRDMADLRSARWLGQRPATTRRLRQPIESVGKQAIQQVSVSVLLLDQKEIVTVGGAG
jgi:hypothetical protein